MTKPSSSLVQAILGSGSIVGVMDAVAASVYSYLLRGGTPAGVFRYVASGVFGKDALTGGGQMVAYGLLFHFTVAIGWTGLYFLVAPHLRFLASNKVVAGIVYGVLVWLAMNFVVVPLSQVASGPIRLTTATAIMILIHMFVIGVPIAFLAERYYSK